jgi:hypothetical protein
MIHPGSPAPQPRTPRAPHRSGSGSRAGCSGISHSVTNGLVVSVPAFGVVVLAEVVPDSGFVSVAVEDVSGAEVSAPPFAVLEIDQDS